ncbi:succinylglutamate desuccinylase/aspartoacylase family protein [Rufibacter latericius]|uniref:Succinylglutamate desuccinylase/aspartoacylase family protein n=1 Tax=Rufibacter latericius TaxID=2487040 RepID=A0A3M9N160_9BACT|nr:succinylglutamate desuccinylase/aspartoacylase family protein [Rufibacter latericius]RNI31534.1 succinylglutamate desuccinylase/aspartoacylase family protein [Rufibacter latericius]
MAEMIINDIPIYPGDKKLIRLNISRLPSGTEIDIPIHVFRAEEPGPVLVLMAGMHGDEVNGVEVIRRMIRRKLLTPLRGTVLAIPILNIYGFLNFSREVPDGKDVNRSFPGYAKGSLASRVAARFTKEVLPLIDYGIDFHTGGASKSNYPQIRCRLEDGESDALAKAFGAPFVLNSNYRPGSLRKEASGQGKTIIVYETGESLRFDEPGIIMAMEGTQRVMHHLGMTEALVPISQPPVICHHTTWIRAPRAGLFRSFVKNGQEVTRGQQIGAVSDPYGEATHPITTHVSGHVVGLNHMPVVNQGDAILHIGY